MTPETQTDGLFIGLVTFERDGDTTEILPPEAHGACGWLAVRAAREDQVMALLREALGAIGLRLLELDRLTALASSEELADYDLHLAANLEDWAPGSKILWGTLHVYLADGEA